MCIVQFRIYHIQNPFRLNLLYFLISVFAKQRVLHTSLSGKKVLPQCEQGWSWSMCCSHMASKLSVSPISPKNQRRFRNVVFASFQNFSQSIQSVRLSAPVVRIGTPRKECVSSQDPQGGRATLACGVRGGGTQFGRLDRKAANLYTLQNFFSPLVLLVRRFKRESSDFIADKNLFSKPNTCAICASIKISYQCQISVDQSLYVFIFIFYAHNYFSFFYSIAFPAMKSIYIHLCTNKFHHEWMTCKAIRMT